MKKIIFLIFSLLEIPFILLSWIDYLWNLICKTISSFFFPFVILSIVTWPITFINGLILASIIFLKNNIVGNNITFADAVHTNISRFPKL